MLLPVTHVKGPGRNNCMETNEIDIEELVSSRRAFNDFVYTPLDEALKEIERRSHDESLKKKVLDFLPAGIPGPLQDKKGGIIFRQLATPNYEIKRFIHIMDVLQGIHPVIWEYHNDKFTSNNECKHALGKMHFYSGKGKNGGLKIETMNVIDFNVYNGKKIHEVQTLWGESLIDHHHGLLAAEYKDSLEKPYHLFDSSEWFSKSGGSAKEYYRNFLALFVQNAILFENFMLDEKELGFTKETFLPSFIEVMKAAGHKPLIVALEPTDIEGDKFWLCYPPESLAPIKEKIELL